MTVRAPKSSEPKAEPRRKTQGAKAYRKAMLPKVRELLELGADDEALARWFGVSLGTFRDWAAKNKPLREALEDREEIRKWDHERNMTVARELGKLGASEVVIAIALGISPRTLIRWRVKYPEFNEALKTSLDVQIHNVEQSLYRMAIGYNMTTEKHVNSKDGPQKVTEIVEVGPDAGAARSFLAAKKPEEWSPKIKPGQQENPDEISEVLNKTGFGTAPINERDEG